MFACPVTASVGSAIKGGIVNHRGPNTRVYIVDDDPSVRKSLERLVQTSNHDTRTFPSAKQFLQTDRANVPSCVVVDLKMPGMDGLELQRALQEAKVTMPVIFLSGHGDVPSSVQAIKQGAVDFLEKPVSQEVLLARIQEAIQKDEEGRKVREHRVEIRRRFELLTTRERQVMGLVVKGLLNKQVAFDLGISEKTVKVHRARVMSKMEADSLAELVRPGPLARTA